MGQAGKSLEVSVLQSLNHLGNHPGQIFNVASYDLHKFGVSGQLRLDLSGSKRFLDLLGACRCGFLGRGRRKQVFSYPLQELALAYGLGQVVGAAGLQAALDVSLHGLGGKGNNGGVGVVGYFPNQLCSFESVNARHLDIQDDKAKAIFSGQVHRLGSVRTAENPVAGPFEEHLQKAAVVNHVLGNQYRARVGNGGTRLLCKSVCGVGLAKRLGLLPPALPAWLAAPNP